MTRGIIKDVYRVSLGKSTCRSGETLATMLVRDVDGVEIVSVDKEGMLIALASSEADLYQDILSAVVTAGFAPDSVVATPFERISERMSLTLAETVALEAHDTPREPVRVPVETSFMQRVRIEVTDGYDPADIAVSAGIPVEITFTEGSGCLAKVVFEGLGIEADLTQGGAVVTIPALEPGVYPFSCGMHLVHGSITAD
jgi:plastocyanin